ncbi:hypothetical protein [Massilia eburnea]|uniref:hypothetical protein n=1 Tax=Massilia eburnea TaxID=1776165 RepID=UPI003D6ABA27
MTMKEDSKTEDDFRRALWQAALIGLIVTAIEFVLFALILKSNQKGWTVELFLLLAAPVAALVGLVAGALFMRSRPAVEAFWIVPIATSPFLLWAIELSR